MRQIAYENEFRDPGHRGIYSSTLLKQGGGQNIRTEDVFRVEYSYLT